MENFKFTLFSLIILALFGFVGYWAVTTIQSGPEYVASETTRQLQKENEDLKKEVKNLTDELDTLKRKLEKSTADAKQEEINPSTETAKTTEITQSIVYKNQNLIDELQKMVNDKVVMRLGSRGTRVGTVQNFLNLYNNTSNKVDNDFGASSKEAIIKFQKDQGLKADGEAGAGTFNKMIEWLKTQG